MSNNTEGTWGHSSNSGGLEYAIFSVDTGCLDYVTLTGKRHAALVFMAQSHIAHKLVFGSYNGQGEVAFVVKRAALGALLASGLLDDQESVLILGTCDARDRRPATLYFLDRMEPGDSEPTTLLQAPHAIGLFQQVTQEYAKTCDGWTYDPTTRFWFTAVR